MGRWQLDDGHANGMALYCDILQYPRRLILACHDPPVPFVLRFLQPRCTLPREDIALVTIWSCRL